MGVCIDYLLHELRSEADTAVVRSEPLPKVYDYQRHLCLHQLTCLGVVLELAERSDKPLIHRSGELGERRGWLIAGGQT